MQSGALRFARFYNVCRLTSSIDEAFFIDNPNLAGAFLLWLLATPEAAVLSGRFVSANWDVTELKAILGDVHGNDLKLNLV